VAITLVGSGLGAALTVVVDELVELVYACLHEHGCGDADLAAVQLPDAHQRLGG